MCVVRIMVIGRGMCRSKACAKGLCDGAGGMSGHSE
jgi:hypothetical protein